MPNSVLHSDFQKNRLFPYSIDLQEKRMSETEISVYSGFHRSLLQILIVVSCEKVLRSLSTFYQNSSFKKKSFLR